MSPPSIWKLPPKHSHFAETRSISLMQAAGTRIPLIERKGYLRSPIRNEVEHSAKKILAECSTRWPSAQYFRSIIQPNYQFASAPSIFCACFRARKQQMLFLRDTFCFSTAPEIGSSRTMPITRKSGSGPIEVNDELILLASPIFRARIHDIVEFIEDLLTSSGPDSSLTYGSTCEDERNGSGRLSNWRWRKASLSGFTRVYSPTMTLSRISSVCTPLRWPSLQKRIAGVPLISSRKSTLSAGMFSNLLAVFCGLQPRALLRCVLLNGCRSYENRTIFERRKMDVTLLSRFRGLTCLLSGSA